jgi:hypothetical protein
VARYIAISCDEVTRIDSQSWVNVHAYHVDEFKHIPTLLNLEKLMGGGTAKNK